ncbi:hypothetical protein [Burkholderia sp. Ac-20365]|uniref:hypothetical protein n=1 Tax=Burkholderia sp. Ac-20365 TaxID=2703897 RepID=UPI00197C507C|nr:hypothetical protein [Burkholderia sp. Ac-20365]MBN3760900.1 hypothetical protein [Burkholderia sp. Ac-20365]
MSQKTSKPAARAHDNLSIFLLRSVCASGLNAGDIWRPRVVASHGEKGWTWRDTRETAGDAHGPFESERDALLDAILKQGVEGETSAPMVEKPSGSKPGAPASTFGADTAEAPLGSVSTAELVQELCRRGGLTYLHGAVGALYDHLEREGQLDGKDKLLTYLVLRLRREDAAVSGVRDAASCVAHWQAKIDSIGQAKSDA